MRKVTFLCMFLMTSLGFSQVVFDFEGTPPTFGDFNGSFTQVIGNPAAGGVNTSDNVAENTVPANAEFAGTNIAQALDFANGKGFTMQVWSSVADTPVLLKLENATTGVNVERSVSLTTVQEWEEITFDFSGEGDLTFESVTVFMNFNMVDAADRVYYWDNLTQTVIDTGAPVVFPVDFENGDSTYALLGFEGAVSSVEDNPDMSGVNISGRVVRTEKTDGAQFFAGTTLTLDAPIDFSNSEIVNIKTWSPKADIPVRVKLETADPNVFVELDVNTTVASEWEELAWDFTGMTGGNEFIKVIVFFEFIVDLPGDGSVYYYDELRTSDQVLSTTEFDPNSITAYPNPVVSNWTLRASEDITSVTVYDVLGKQVAFETPATSNYTMNMASLVPGVYMATVTTEAGSKSYKLVKN